MGEPIYYASGNSEEIALERRLLIAALAVIVAGGLLILVPSILVERTSCALSAPGCLSKVQGDGGWRAIAVQGSEAQTVYSLERSRFR